MTEALGVGAATETPCEYPTHVYEDSDDFGVFLSCGHCTSVQRLMLPIRVGWAMEVRRTFARTHAKCVKRGAP